MFMLQLAARAHRKVVCRIRSGAIPRQHFAALLFVACLAAPDVRNGQAGETALSAVPLHKRIDQATESAAIGPLANICSDADFVRRVYLDLTGVIPTPDETKAFLVDESIEKRSALINRLIESVEFSRHVAVQWNVVLLDRRTDKYVDQKSWETYLIDSIDSRKPLDQIYRELIYPDDIADGVTPARKFLLNRGVEPHAMTRDVGRMLFGMDLQCAQCHDHPLVDDYYQADYYGLFAFLNRSSLFEDPETKVGKLAEKADGEAPFESVFTGKGKTITRPRLPKGAFVYADPRLPEDQAYQVKPEKTQAAKPTFSRRETLAKMLADNLAFRRNVANRLWAMVMGRGLVHPSDFHYLDNPPVNPELLTMLADDLSHSGFDLRHAVREMMLSKTYQRDCEPPAFETINLADIRYRLDRIEQQRESLSAKLSELRSLKNESEESWIARVAIDDKLDSDWIAMAKPMADAKKALEAATGELAIAAENQQAVAKKAAAIEGVLVATEAAYQKLSDEQPLADAIALLQKRKGELASDVAKAQSELQAKTQADTTARQALEKLKADAVAIDSQRIAPDELTQLEQKFLDVQSKLWDVDAGIKLLDAQAAQCQNILDHALLVDSDPEKAAMLWSAIVDRWTLQGQVAALKPLTPEQLAASTMRATGFLARSEAAAKAAVEKTPPAELAAADLPDEAKSRIKNVAVQVELLNQLRGSVNQFVDQFGGLAGEEFQATVNQALFLGNSPTVNNWLAPADGTLVGKLKSIEAVEALADELSLAVLSRPATIDEQREVQRFLTPAEGQPATDRTATIAELVWAVITSNEFRFNH